jgi:signal transduction histidine kinase
MENSNQINQEKYIKYLNESNKELRDFIISLNDFIKNKSTNKYFYIDEKVRSVIKLVNYRIIKNNLSVKLISESKIKVYGSDLKLQQVILNLISNSIDSYTDHTGNKKEINISIYKTKRNVFIKIQDYGCGIDKKMKDKIFNLYQSTKSEGFGIGLHTVKSIIENDFKGKIICSSSKETGTTFTITIPT